MVNGAMVGNIWPQESIMSWEGRALVNFIIWVCDEHLYHRRCDLSAVFGRLGMLARGLVLGGVRLTDCLRWVRWKKKVIFVSHKGLGESRFMFGESGVWDDGHPRGRFVTIGCHEVVRSCGEGGMHDRVLVGFSGVSGRWKLVAKGGCK